MYARIIVALDGSPLAEQVLLYVEALADRFGSTITLLRATMTPDTLLTGSMAGESGLIGDPTPLVEADRREAVAYLTALAARLHAQRRVVQRDYPAGSAAEVIVQRARDVGADLIAMTTHGRGGLGRLVFGSVADAVLRSAPCPVLLVRASEPSTAATRPT
jgi:nucleotide-binding universal stress UspA family protein